jgi:hypothetical protein
MINELWEVNSGGRTISQEDSRLGSKHVPLLSVKTTGVKCLSPSGNSTVFERYFSSLCSVMNTHCAQYVVLLHGTTHHHKIMIMIASNGGRNQDVALPKS